VKLEGSVVVVTGGSSGLGGATVAALVGESATVVVFDRQVGPGSELAIASGGAYVETDVRSESDVVKGTEVASALGPVRALVCCAGITAGARTAGRDGSLERAHRLADFQRVIDVNLVGTFNCVRVVSTAMGNETPDEVGERGAIVMTASIAAFDGQLGQAAYAASKAGIVGMTLPIARDLSDLAIRVNTIAPGVMKTPMLGDVGDSVLENIAAVVPFPKRVGDPEEYAALALALLTNRYMNAETVRLDGGLRMPPR
jgi:NAD(P)-dependent dehydrogenase (short-subunit alcohol dehydrogenase family)